MTTSVEKATDAGYSAAKSSSPKDMSKRLVGWLRSSIVWTIGIVTFLLPFVYANWTVEYLRYNKLIVMLIGTVIVAVLWAIRIGIEKEIRLKKTLLDWPILIVLGSALISLLMSKIQSQSFWGTFPNFEDSFLLIAMGVINFYALINHIRGGKDWLMIIGMILLSSTLLAVVTLLQYFGLYLLPFRSITGNNLFSPFGTVFQAGYLLAVIAPLASGFLIGSMSDKRYALSGLTGILLVTSLLVFGVINYWPVWIVAAFGMVVSSLISMVILGENKRNWAFIPLGLFLLALIVFKMPGVRTNLPGFSLIPDQPITLDLSASLDVAKQSFNQNGLFGLGEGNYGYTYKLLKPLAFNQRADWLLNYNRPYNELFLTFTTMGFLGLLAFGYLLLRVISLVLKALLSYAARTDADPAVVGLFISLASFVLVMLFSWQTIPLRMLFWVLLVLAIYIGFEPDVSGIVGEKVYSLKLSSTNGNSQGDFLAMGVTILIGSVALYTGYQAVLTYLVDVDLRQAINYGNDGDTNNSLVAQNKVVTSSAVTDFQLRGVAIILHNQGVAAEVSQDNQDQQVTDLERKRAFFRESVRFAREAVGKNPNASENYEVLLGVYSTLAEYGINAIDQIPLTNLMTELRTQLATLTPADVTWRIRMANYFIGAEDYNNAISLLGQANTLKGNLVDVHYLAALALGGEKDFQNAIVEANIALRSLAADHPWATTLNDKIAEWSAEETAAEKAAAKTPTPETTTP